MKHESSELNLSDEIHSVDKEKLNVCINRNTSIKLMNYLFFSKYLQVMSDTSK